MLQTIIRKPRTAEDIAQGARLAKMQNREIGPVDVARVLDAAKVKYVLVGAHATNGYTGRPRATDMVLYEAADRARGSEPHATPSPSLRNRMTTYIKVELRVQKLLWRFCIFKETP